MGIAKLSADLAKTKDFSITLGYDFSLQFKKS